MGYEVMDLARERARERDWELLFDSGPNGDLRTMVWEHPCPDEAGHLSELEIGFSPDGRIVFSERRRGGIAHKRVGSPEAFASTEICLEALHMI